jgi:hypothetical protein
VTVLEGRTGFFEALDSAAGDDEPDSARSPLGATGAFAGAAPQGTPFRVIEHVAPDLVPYVTSLAALASGEEALTTLPYALLLR